MEEITFTAKKRSLEGSSNVRRMRNAGKLPAVLYGDDKDSVSLEIDAHSFQLLLDHHTSESLIVEVSVEDEGAQSVLIKDVQHHPVTGDVLHVDFMRVAANKPIQVEVQLEMVGEAAGVKAGGTLDQVLHSIDVECLPADLVEKFEVDVSALNIGDSMDLTELKLGSTFTLLTDEDSIIASVAAPRAEEEEDEEGVGVAAPAAEPEVIGEKKEDDSE